MKPFLQSIAEQYLKRYSDLSEFMFVFPSKRSGTFFSKYLAEALKDNQVILAPAITTISELVQSLSGRILDSRIDLLFTLYKSYLDLFEGKDCTSNPPVSFDSFRAWGDVVISDFNDVDLYCVDAREVFKNVKDFREIETDYLTDEQREVMEEYFGTSVYAEHFERFWRAFEYEAESEDKRSTDVRHRFMMLWEILWPLYEKFNARLEKEGLAYSGRTYLLALDEVREKGLELFKCRRIVFVGFNALSKAEWMLFRELKKLKCDAGCGIEPFADFFWDCSSPLLQDTTCSASKFILKDIKQFPSPDWVDMTASDVSNHVPEFCIVSSPSNSLQSKIIGSEIKKIISKRRLEESDSIDMNRMAIVLPDENLLLPVLYSLPKNLDVNLTMGFSLRLSSVYSFVQLLRRLQAHQRGNGEETEFLASDVISLVSHPFMLLVNGNEQIMRLKGYVGKLRKFTLTRSEIERFCSTSKSIFEPLDKRCSYRQAARYLVDALSLCRRYLVKDSSSTQINVKIDRDFIDIYCDALRRMEAAVDAHSIEMDYRTFFHLTDRLLGGETVNFEGEPLSGIQIMGLLETRCLDFDQIIIPSMNERIFPRRQKVRSFIPASLRKAYGLPIAGYDESIFAYYFYRLVGRANCVTLLYDSRTGGLKNGDPSRYIQQLRYLYGGTHVKEEEYRFKMGKTDSRIYSFIKTEETMKILNSYRIPGNKAFSASTLMKYLSCPLQFYYEKILGLKPKEELQEGLDPIMIGNILHKSLLEVYLPPEKQQKYLDQGEIFTGERIDQILEDRNRIFEIVRTNVIKELFQGSEDLEMMALSTDMEMMAQMLAKQVINVLKRDKTITPFVIHGLEFSEESILTLSDGSKVNFTCTIDRMDTPHMDKGDSMCRIVDYKTGDVHATAFTSEDVYTAAYCAKHFFQLQLYANLHNFVTGDLARPIAMAVYNIPKILKADFKSDGVKIPKLSNKLVANHLVFDLEEEDDLKFNQQFMQRVKETVEEILDPDVPFRNTEDETTCTYCKFRGLCGR